MKTAEDYWQDACAHGAGSLGRLPVVTQNLARLTFLAGFSACLDVLARAAEMPDEQAQAYMTGLFNEIDAARATILATLHAAGGETIQ